MLSKTKVAIVCEAIPRYRIPIYQRLADTSLIDLEVVATFPHRSRPGGIKDVEFCGDFKESRMRMWALVFRQKRFKILPYLVPYILKKRPDVLVFADSIFQPMLVNFLFWIFYKLSGAKLIRWGCFGYKDPSEYPTTSSVDRLILWLKNMIFRWNYADAELAYSEFTAKYLHEQMGVSRERIFIAYNSIDTERIDAALEICKATPPILPRNDRRIIFIGRLVKQKRGDILLRAFKAVSERLSGCELLIIGDGPERQELQRLTNELSINQTVTFLGAIYDEVLKGRYMLSSCLFVLPGLGGLSINEAMCYGLPVVCSIADGTEEQLVHDGITGYIANYGDANDYADKICTILRDKALQMRMGENARAIIKNKVNIQSMISGFHNALHYVMEDSY